MHKKHRTSLEAKLCVMTIGLLFAVLLGVGHYAMGQQKAALLEQQRQAFEALARAVAVASEPVVSHNGASVGQRILDDLNDTALDIEYIVVSDETGKPLLARSQRSEHHPARAPLVQKARRIAGFVTGYEDVVNNVYRTTLPIRMASGRSGLVSVGFSLNRVNSAIEEMQTNILVVFAVAFLVGIVGALLLARSISRQLRKLIETARAVAHGDLSRTVSEDSGDEVGELSHAFNCMMSALRESQEKLIQRANTDSLTDLYNHRYFQERLTAELSRAARYKHVLSILMIDIDHFKNFNDWHGHPSGDKALRELAKIMKAEVRDMDVVARYGGEEFSVILPETDVEDAFAAGERLRLAVQRHCFYGKDQETVPLTISVGVGQYPLHSIEREGLIMAADMALYRAKSTGRNKTCRFEQQLRDNPAGDPYRVHVLLRATDIRTVEALASAIDAKHHFMTGHGKAVASHAAKLAEALGMPTEECDSVRLASLLRDIGQLALPDGILVKPEPLTPEDREIVSSHPTLGHAIVEKSPGMKSMLPGILHHHENYDGSGYPFGLAGEEIPLVARVIAVVDAYCSMTADRPHRAKLTPEAAMAELERCTGKQFDPEVVKAFVTILKAEDPNQLAA
ncbi:MAG: diguanylate cyclase [Armatimonadota bacterium]|nr:diguanylate cyclase [Armatimonadota bacterium]